MKKQIISEEFRRMQKLAGIITESQLNEGFLDNVANSIKGKSEQGKLAQAELAKMGISKNPVEIFSTGMEKGGAGPFENEVQDFIERGGDVNTKIPFSKNIKSSAGGAIFKETYTFDFSKDVPTMKSGGKFIWNIKGGKWEPFGDKDGNENKEEPIDIESMKKETDAEPGEYATEAVMMTIADAAKIWPGGYGERLRDIIAKKGGDVNPNQRPNAPKPTAQPQQEHSLNEDNLEVKRIAKDLYSFLKKNGVEVKLLAHGDKSYKKIGQIDQGMSMGKTMDNAGIISYYDDPTTKQTIIQIQLYGGPTSKDLVVGVEKKLLATYPGLEQFDRQEIPGKTNFQLNFRVREKTTKKGGLVGNTKTNPKPTTQPQAESLNIESIVNEALKKFRKK